MRSVNNEIELSASDLSQFLGCKHRTALDLAVATGARAAPTWVDPALLLMRERGLEHERAYADLLRAEGLDCVELGDAHDVDALPATLAAMQAGVPVILQPALRDGRWFGRPDILRRRETPSSLGGWSYEVIDTKLARETRGGAILQLALYSDLLTPAQGRVPDAFHVVTPNPEHPVQSFRFADFGAYFRLIRRRLDATAALTPEVIASANYPEPVEHCDVCRWWAVCDQRRRTDDHLSLVAGLSRAQSRELEATGVTTLAQLGALPLPLPFTPRRGAVQAYVRIHEQARVQLAGRTIGVRVHELLPIVADQGLARLPAPSAGDIFLDLEGDPFAGSGGSEYLFGLVVIGEDGEASTRALWALSPAEELHAFEAVIDEVQKQRDAHPHMHVYHYAPYEPAALKRLMGRYASREAEIDDLLRGEIFVDLYAVVRHSLRASVERYSIKDLEPFYGFARSVALVDARTNLRLIERALELGTTAEITPEARAVVEGYNREDCLSAMQLRAWLEQLRTEVERSGTAVPRPVPKDGAASEKLTDRGRRVRALVERLLQNVPVDSDQRNEEQHARWLLAHLLDWHRREDKAPWWEFFRLRDLPEDELLGEKSALAGLRFVERVVAARSPVDRYAYPAQDTEVRKGNALHLPDGTDFGTVETLNRDARTVDVKKRGAQASVHPSALFAHDSFPSDTLADALLRIGYEVADNGAMCDSRYRATLQLLLGRSPRLKEGIGFAMAPGEAAPAFAMRVAAHLDHSVLALQGPPGAGKTYTGAQMICDSVRRGKRIGVTAVSHKVIRKLLVDVAKMGAQQGLTIECAHKVNEKDPSQGSITELTDNGQVMAPLASGSIHVAGGTQWLWARPDAEAAVDYLFVDEAGQMSLANVVAASQAARNVVLLGDPQQLEQPQQGTHPEGADASSLEHMLRGAQTIPPDRGIFLPETWRLAPEICAFTSEVFYESRLTSRRGLEQQRLLRTEGFDGAGLWLAPVAHEGNQNSSVEEADAVEKIVDALLQPDAAWINAEGLEQPLTPADILIVAPYNTHVTLLSERLSGRGVSVGTVDRFQGQEAPVVIYSMATSFSEDAPRGMEFLYSLNRLNVATSRARCACIIVASPRLFEPECKTPRQMQLANALCRYGEMARDVVV